MKIEFIASLGVIAADPPKSRELYVDALGLALEASEGDDYFHSERVGGSKHFGVWPLTQAARACFGGPDWPASRPVPQVSIEFEVADADAMQAAAEELQAQGVELLHGARTEPWGQTVARLQSIEGCVIGISYARGCTTGADRGRSVLITIVNACLRDGRAGSPTAVLEEASLTELERRQVPKLMPGPTIEARVGEEIVIRLRNSLREPTVVHWHGLRIPAEMAACRAGRDIRVSACPA